MSRSGEIPDIRDTIARYREANGSERPGATWETLRKLQGKLGCMLPSELIALYLDHDGTDAYTDLPFRFMPVAEVAGWFDMMREYYVVTPDINCLDHGLRAFWTDDNANYACVYVSGPFTGRVAFLDHEVTASLEPRFRSVESFLEACLSTSAESWYGMEIDTPDASRLRSRPGRAGLGARAVPGTGLRSGES